MHSGQLEPRLRGQNLGAGSQQADSLLPEGHPARPLGPKPLLRVDLVVRWRDLAFDVWAAPTISTVHFSSQRSSRSRSGCRQAPLPTDQQDLDAVILVIPRRDLPFDLQNLPLHLEVPLFIPELVSVEVELQAVDDGETAVLVDPYQLPWRFSCRTGRACSNMVVS